MSSPRLGSGLNLKDSLEHLTGTYFEFYGGQTVHYFDLTLHPPLPFPLSFWIIAIYHI